METRISMHDVFGKTLGEHGEGPKVHNGMVVASGLKDFLPDVCPIWGDEPPYKSVTVICAAELEAEVAYWLEYVLGGGCISKIKALPDDRNEEFLRARNRVAMRADYKCW